MITVRLPRDAERLLEQAAKRSGKSKAAFARDAIEKYMDELEARYTPEGDDANEQQTAKNQP